MKKLISAIILFAMILTLVPTMVISSSAADEYPAVKWNSGMFVGSVYNAYGLKMQYGASSDFAATDVFTVPKAGTKLTWTDPKSGYASNSVLVVSSWKKDTSGIWFLDLDNASYTGTSGSRVSAVSTLSTSAGVIYTYITSKDNENLRLCYNRGTETVHPTVTFSQTTQKGTWQSTIEKRISDIPVPKTKNLGFALNASTITTEWYYGYVGSDTHTSSPYGIVKGGLLYLYSDVITIEKSGTTIYFFDDTQVDGDSSSYASASAFVFSHWKQSGSSWVIDKDKDNRNGSKADTLMFGEFKMYSYTTTEDNTNLRLCYRAANADLGVEPTMFPVYLYEPYGDYSVETTIGILKDQSFKKADDSVVNYKIYLPEGYDSSKKYKLIYNVGEDLSLITEAINNKGTMIISSFTGETAPAGEVLEFITDNYAVNKNYIYLTGSPELSKQYPDVFASTLENASSFDSALAALEDMLATKPTYYKTLDNLTMYAIGDSYFQGAGIGSALTWPSLLASKYYMNHINYGVGGNTIGYFSGVNTTTQLPMCDRYKTMEDNANANIILLEGGRNDRSKKIPFGANDSTDKNTFKGALNIAISGLLEKYPDALIICVTAWNYNDSTGATDGYAGTTAQYAVAMMELVDYLDNKRVVCFNAADKNLSGVDMNDAAFKTKYSINPTDISHLNPEGMKLILPNFEKFIAEEYMKYIDYQQTTETPDFLLDTTAADTTAQQTDTVTDNDGCSCGKSSVFITIAATVTALGVFVIAKKKF